MKLIVGLGNPGRKYVRSRHNVGRIIVSKLKRLLPNENVIFATPDVYMNSSGIPVKRLIQKHKVGLGDLLIIHDDMDLAFGKLKLQKDRGAAGHHGVESIIAELGSQDFWRLRIGVGRPLSDEIEPDDYVMGDLTKEQLSSIKEIACTKISPLIENWIAKNLPA